MNSKTFLLSTETCSVNKQSKMMTHLQKKVLGEYKYLRSIRLTFHHCFVVSFLSSLLCLVLAHLFMLTLSPVLACPASCCSPCNVIGSELVNWCCQRSSGVAHEQHITTQAESNTMFPFYDSFPQLPLVTLLVVSLILAKVPSGFDIIVFSKVNN